MILKAKENPSGYFGIPLKTQEQNDMNQIEKHSIQWKQVIEEIRKSSKNLMENQYFEIRYEDLIKNTKKCLDEITKFCELPCFNFVFRKNDVLYNSEGKEPFGWELMDIPNIANRNITPFDGVKSNKKNSEIEKYVYKTLMELNYA